MLNIYVYATQPELANKAVEQLKAAGADHVEVLAELKIPARPPKDNRYLLVCETPAEKLADLMPKVLQESEYVAELGTWYEAQTQILGAYAAHKKRAVLVSASQLAGNPIALVQHINAQWQCRLTAPEAAQPSEVNSKEDQLLGYLVQNLIEKTPPLQHLAISQAQATGEELKNYSESDAIDAFRKLKATKSDIQTQIANTNQQLAKFESLQEESELLLLQLHQVQEELERIYLEAQGYKETAEREKAELTASRDAEAHRANNLQEETELLLLQLHQVQEELENYFLKNQESEAKLSQQQARLKRVLEKLPDFIATESVRVEVVDSKTQTLKWVVDGLEGHGIAKEHLEFETFVESGVLGIRFNKINSRNEPNLKIWPSSCTSETLECIPAGKGNIMRQRAIFLRDLSASDWKLINALPQLIKEHLCSAELETQLGGAASESATKFLAGINALPKTFRYDLVTLKANKVNPDYEHLWFELHNASYDTYNWPKFEFRLGAAHIKPGQFSKYPKIEIPLIDGSIKPFASWFDESHDDFGPKWELRFDLNKKIYDSDLWLKLDSKDRDFIKQVLETFAKDSLPIDGKKIRMHRGFEDWSGLFRNCVSLIKK